MFSFQTYEVAGLRFAHGLVPASAFVSVPKVHMEDPERNFYIVDDCGSDVKTLKQLMIDHVLPNDQAHAVGVGLATFIATVHGKGSEVLSEDAKAYKLFGTNKAGRDIAAWRYYGRLLNVLEGAGDFTGNGLIGLPLKTPLNDLERLGSIAASMNKEVLAEHPTLTMGDFWTGNILVNFSNDAGKVTVNKMWVVDWEIAQTGITGLDVGQMMGEMYFLRHFLPRNEEPIGQLRAGFFSTYKEKYGMDEEMVKRVAAHVGSHLITIGSTVKWGTEDETRGVVQDGVEYVLKAHSDDSAWLKACFVGGLL